MNTDQRAVIHQAIVDIDSAIAALEMQRRELQELLDKTQEQAA